MSDWAESAAKKAAEQDHVRELNLEKSLRDGRIKDQVGSELFNKLQEWIVAEVEKFNALRRKQELSVRASSQPNPIANQLDRAITVSRPNGSHGPLKITYSVTTHTVSYECGIGHGTFTLKVGDDQTAHFQAPHGLRVSIEEMGTEMLNKFMDSPI